MGRKELIACFEDTQRMALGPLSAQTAAACSRQRVYEAGFVAAVLPLHEQDCPCLVEAASSLQSARVHRGGGRVAVLNFANPVNPGGGVTRGARAQEEDLCRCSSLYPCLCDGRVADAYYGYHRALRAPEGSDRLIYTRDVPVFKEGDPVPQLLAMQDWFNVDIITCAAPYLPGMTGVKPAPLQELFKRRIRCILEAAIDNRAEVLILGAFGCGAFGNPPSIVAPAFREVLAEERYLRAFTEIVFAVKPGEDGSSPNLDVFRQVFPQGLSAAKEQLQPNLRLRDEGSGELLSYWGNPLYAGSNAAVCAIVLDSPDAARIHAVFQHHEGAWYLLVYGASGVTVNGQLRTARDQALRLNWEDQLLFPGGRCFVLCAPQLQEIRAGSTLQGRKGSYQILKEAGRGGMSIVYLAMERQTGRALAVKYCRMPHESEYAQLMAAQLRCEAAALEKLSAPGIPVMSELLEMSDGLCLIREYCKGEPLSALVRKQGPLPVGQVLRIGVQLCRLLSYMHTLQPPMLYLDMKPSNVLMRKDGFCSLIDFSTAREYVPGQEEENLGTMGYAAPETFRGQAQPASDLYSLGVTLHQLLTGLDPSEPPYELPPIRTLRPELPRELENILKKCLQLEPKDRYRSADELRAALEGWRLRKYLNT